MHHIARHNAALEREHEARRKHWIKETKCVPDQEQTFFTAIARVKRKFVRDEVFAHLRAGRQVIFDPEILLDLAVEDCFRIFDPAPRQVLRVSDDTDAYHVVMLRDVPEPALLRHKGDRRRAGIDARVAFRSFVIRPHCHLIQLRIAQAPMIAYGGEGFFA